MENIICISKVIQTDFQAVLLVFLDKHHKKQT